MNHALLETHAPQTSSREEGKKVKQRQSIRIKYGKKEGPTSEPELFYLWNHLRPNQNPHIVKAQKKRKKEASVTSEAVQ